MLLSKRKLLRKKRLGSSTRVVSLESPIRCGANLNEERAIISGGEALNVLSRIQGCTYVRPDLQERRLGLSADEVEDAIELLGVDNVVGRKRHQGELFRT